MATRKNINIEILGTTVSIVTDEGPEYLEELKQYYYSVINRIQQNSKLDDPLKIAVLAGFLLCDDIKEVQDSKEESQDSEYEALNHLIARIDSLLAQLKIHFNRTDLSTVR
ncbi:MAG: cell division protein ZapA [Treponema sp.]|jgi:cell division protein ZapA (FtsZ GTPase activity inhibitor)|nr:cell division protein ZapA [Treponema sp.]